MPVPAWKFAVTRARFRSITDTLPSPWLATSAVLVRKTLFLALIASLARSRLIRVTKAYPLRIHKQRQGCHSIRISDVRRNRLEYGNSFRRQRLRERCKQQICE